MRSRLASAIAGIAVWAYRTKRNSTPKSLARSPRKPEDLVASSCLSPWFLVWGKCRRKVASRFKGLFCSLTVLRPLIRGLPPSCGYVPCWSLLIFTHSLRRGYHGFIACRYLPTDPSRASTVTLFLFEHFAPLSHKPDFFLVKMLSAEKAPRFRINRSPLRAASASRLNFKHAMTTLPDHMEHIWIITGPAGCGKTTVAQHLAKELSLPYVEGDDVSQVGSS